MESLCCHGSSDVNKTLIISNFHLYIVQLWYSFSDIFVNADLGPVYMEWGTPV